MREEDLFCIESLVDSVNNQPDTSVLEHEKALENLLRLQKKALPKIPSESRTKIEASSRKVVATWMLEVSRGTSFALPCFEFVHATKYCDMQEKNNWVQEKNNWVQEKNNRMQEMC